jgi:hypothetical protein
VSSAAGSPSLTAAGPAPPPAQTPAQAAAAARRHSTQHIRRRYTLKWSPHGSTHKGAAKLHHCTLHKREAIIGMLLPLSSLHDATAKPQFVHTVGSHQQRVAVA